MHNQKKYWNLQIRDKIKKKTIQTDFCFRPLGYGIHFILLANHTTCFIHNYDKVHGIYDFVCCVINNGLYNAVSSIKTKII